MALCSCSCTCPGGGTSSLTACTQSIIWTIRRICRVDQSGAHLLHLPPPLSSSTCMILSSQPSPLHLMMMMMILMMMIMILTCSSSHRHHSNHCHSPACPRGYKPSSLPTTGLLGSESGLKMANIFSFICKYF